MSRYLILDGFRGFFLLFMMIIHMNGPLNTTVGKLNHHYFGWVEDAQGFVFISGLVVGIVYGGILNRSGLAVCARRVFKRIQTIFFHQTGLIILFLISALMLSHFGFFPSVLMPYVENPISFPITSLLLISASMHMGILPMYIWFLIITPFVLEGFKRNYSVAIFSISLLLWLFAQMQISGPLLMGVEQNFGYLFPEVHFGLFFNVFGWQTLFFSGLYIGWRQSNGRLDLSFLKGKQWVPVIWIAIFGFFSLGIYDRMVFDSWLGEDFKKTVLSSTDRGNFSLIYPIAFIFDLFIVTYLLIAGSESENAILRGLSHMLRRIFTLRFFTFLGQHSLHVFTAHVIIVYFVTILNEFFHLGQTSKSLLVLLSPAPIFIVAWLHQISLQRATVPTARD